MFVEPQLSKSRFTCPHCGMLSRMEQTPVAFRVDRDWTPGYEWDETLCGACNQTALWVRRAVDKAPWQVVHPAQSLSGPEANPHMPPDVRKDYDEARLVAKHSSRAAAALLRLSIQRLCKHLGASGGHINDDIRSLVAEGLPRQAQQALDIVRVMGNECVHPGSIDDSDLPEVVAPLFSLVNFIVQDRIGRYADLDAMYADLPRGLAAKIDIADGRTA